MTYSKKSRFYNVLAHGKKERHLVSGWHHFLEKEQTASDLAEATITFAKQYDWDWIKINPRATYLAEAFGNVYDFNDYKWVFPRQVKPFIQNGDDLNKVKYVNALESEPLKEQLDAVEQIRAALDDMPLVQTVFSPLTILMFLTGHISYVDQTMYGSENPIDFHELLVSHRQDVHQALHAIALTMADYVKELENQGGDGLFYATTGTTHPDLFTESQFDEFSRPYDHIVLQAIKPGGRILHTCGSYADPERFNDYPVEGISWDPDAEGNPDLTVNLDKVKVAGVDHHIFHTEDPEPVRIQAQQALYMMKDQPFLLVPNCAVSPDASHSTLKALRESINN
ncbi:uroporphyrinogen decarboxylase [Pelagirhabdus alkalitolerans]|uniref:Uroporphyrinogen decarboxylase n=1 Tax=Pelagirhabdus alkalitolerans TaxID=1612202 RepID=A0A1G6IZB4_9BACI|nr:uroporphyrinogen decarboxylase family protein [Pelagirhabdus alkalitolerans]SDC11902.1 uroporphyrinogen decarboxylase [Pelagirhabdus alkalitolerans]